MNDSNIPVDKWWKNSVMQDRYYGPGFDPGQSVYKNRKRRNYERSIRRKQEKLIIESTQGGAAANAHTVETDRLKRPKQNFVEVKDLSRNSKKQKQQSTKTTDNSNIKANKPQGFDWRNRQKAIIESKIGKKFFSKKGMLLTAGVLAGVGALGAYGNKTINGMPMSNGPAFGSFDSRAAYIPTSYKRGYSDIKEALTDFGTPCHLDKTIKALVKPLNSTRHRTIQTTNSIYNNNISLYMHKNAINHTRY